MLLGQALVASDNESCNDTTTILPAAAERGTEAPLGDTRAKVTGNTCNWIFVAISCKTFRKPAFTQRIYQCLRSACSLPHCSRSHFAARRRLHRRRVFPTPSAETSRP